MSQGIIMNGIKIMIHYVIYWTRTLKQKWMQLRIKILQDLLAIE